VAKGPEAFRSISEASGELGVPQHVLRFWETKFTFVKPMKRAGGRRFYRPQDIAVLAGVRRLLHDQGYTIKGVQKLHREQGLKRFTGEGETEEPRAAPAPVPASAPTPPPAPAVDRRVLDRIIADLEAAKARLDAALAKG
jgi:DNA-binding transcriptional MerR regulator